MNRKLIVMALLAGSAFSSASYAADGVVNFTGTITDAACTVSPSSTSATVALGTISSKAFSAAGATSAPTRFGITLTTCPASVTTASLKFDGPANSENSGLLALTSGAGVATGVGIGIYESNSTTLIPVGTKSATKALASGADTTFEFVAKYVSTAATVVSGKANATSNFTVSYN
ncbi:MULTISPECIES: fimbrial protein [unclassified Pseudomonas]|uniref:fimbrial protein n=1 Tax=unclassified Pseudomonas TaxID=196821 RepID=UPI000BA4C208|nr:MULTISPECIES: fimbrial protein [unclassified Pseudomonas]